MTRSGHPGAQGVTWGTMWPMATRDGTVPTCPWGEFEAAVPDLAAFVRARLDARRHRLMATLRADGSPRISGIELTIASGELWVGGLPGSRKFADLRRDPRVAIHSGSVDPPAWDGDARLAGRAVFVEDEATKAAFLEAAGGGPPGPFDLVRLDIAEVSTVREAPGRDHLVLEVWRPGEPVRSIDRH
jgi:hypothetical protein